MKKHLLAPIFCLIWFTQLTYGQAPTNGLVAHYTFSGNANDAAGSLNGTPNGATLTTDRFGKPNKAYAFNGSASIDFAGSPVALPLSTTGVTISCWVRPSSLTQTGTFVHIGSDAAPANGFGLGIMPNSFIPNLPGFADFVPIANGTFIPTNNIPVAQPTSWSHVVISADDNGAVIYMNGVLRPGTFTLFIYTVNATTDFTIGSLGSSRYFEGEMDEVRVYNRPLTAQEAQAIYQEELTPKLTLTASNTLSCSVTSATLTTDGADPNATFAYAGPSGTVPGSGSTVTVNTPGVYSVTATAPGGATAVVSTTVTIVPPPSISLTASPSGTVASGTSVTLTASGATSYTWTFGGSPITGNPITVVFFAAPSFTVVNPVSVTGLSGSCSVTTTIQITVLPPVCYPAFRVTQTGAGLQDGSSWANAYAGHQLQQAIDAAALCAGSQVWVAQGVHKPTSGTVRTVSFSMRAGVAIYGGFAGNETTLAGRILTTPSSTTLSGEIGDLTTTADNSYHVISNPSGLTTSAVLDGFVVTGGNANGTGFANSVGGGVLNNGNNSGNVCSPSFRNCTFVANLASSSGGAMHNWGTSSGNSSPQLTNCAFLSNSAPSGGAIYNRANVSGISSPQLTNCSFQNNSATAGGAIFNNGSSSGISSVSLVNCVFFANGGANSFSNTSATITVSYSLFDNTANITTLGPGSLTTSSSPFVSPTSVALAPCSPAIDAGTNSAPGLIGVTTDLAGNNRFFSGNPVDLGAIEFQGAGLPVNFTVLGSGTATCAGSPTITLSGSETGVSYQLLLDGTNTGGVVAGTGSALSFGPKSLSGTYTVLATRTSSSCTLVMAQSATVVSTTAVPTVSLSGSGTLTCLQTSFTLTATGGNTYTFSGPGMVSQNPTAGTAVVNGSGTYSVTVTNTSTGCSSVTTTVVSSNTAAPTVSISGSSTLTCSVTSLTLTATGGTSYTWTGGATGASLPVSASGVYSVTATGANGCTATTTTTIYSNTTVPTPTLTANIGAGVASNTLTCAQLSLTLTATGGTGYTFTGPGILSQNQSAGMAVINAPGLYSVTVLHANTGCFSITTLTMYQNNSGSLSISLTANNILSCSNPNPVLTATPGAASYRFSGPGVSQNSPANTATASTTGVFSVTATSGVCSSSASLTVTGGAGTPPNALLLGMGNLSCQTPTLSLTAVGGSRYQFSGPGGSSAGIVSQTDGRERLVVGDYLLFRTPIPTVGMAVVNRPGLYSVLVTDANGCSATATILITGTACPGGQ